MKARRIAGDIAVYIILTVLAILWVLPIVWLILQSFGNQAGTAAAASFYPSSFWLGNYKGIMTNTRYNYTTGEWEDSIYSFFGSVINGRFYMGAFTNTLVIALFVMVISTLMTLATAYAFSRLRFKSRAGFMRVMLILGMFPGFLSLIIMYWFMESLGIRQTIWSMVIIYSGGAGMNYYISKGFFDTISKQIDEAAMVDGATRFQIFYKIIMPLSKPIVVYTALTAFMSPWGEYITSSYVLGSALNETKSNWTVAIMLNAMLSTTDGRRAEYWGQFCAGAVLVGLPVAILFLIMQRYYVSGVTGGAVKG